MDPGSITVAITGLNARSDNPAPGAAVARCFAASDRRRTRLIGLGYEALESGLYRHDLFDATYMLPFPTAGKDAFFERLMAIHAAESIDVLIPCLDAELPVCISVSGQLANVGIQTFLPTAEQFAYRSKDRLAEAAKAVGVSMPETRRVGDSSFFSTCGSMGWNYPLVVKGALYDAYVAYNYIQATAAFQKILAAWGHPVLVQRHVIGEEQNLTAVGDGKGKMVAPVMMKKRALTDKGKAWAGVCIHDDVLLDSSRRLIEFLKWRGPCEIEGVRDAKGVFHLLEINPRFPAWVYFTHGVGRNLPEVLLDLVLGYPLPSFPDPDLGTLFIRYAEEVILPLSAFENVVTGGSNPKHEKVLTWTP